MHRRLIILPAMAIAALCLRTPDATLGARAVVDVHAASASVAAPTLVRQPYLQRITATSATVVWATREPGPADVRFRKTGGPLRVEPAVTTAFPAGLTAMAFDYYQHEATLTGLEPATTYLYDPFVGGADATPVGDMLTTAPAAGSGDVSFIVFGDSGSGDGNQRRLADLIEAGFAADRWDLALHTGDIVYPRGSYELFHDRFFAYYERWLRRRPIFFGVGNHEYYVADAQPYLDLFAMPENGHDPQAPGYRERYYSFDYGPVHFVALDTSSFSGNAAQQQQLTWLVRDLEATTQPWRIVFMHIPAYGSSDFSSTLGLRNSLQPIFERYGVQLVLAGHEHDYARGAPWREPPASYAPVMHVVSGGGGAGLNDPFPGPWLASWRSAFHYLSVDVTPCSAGASCTLTLEAIDAGGDVFDRFTLPRRAQQQDASPPDVSIVAPAGGAVVSGTTPIAVSATDDQEIVKVDLLVDGEQRLVDDEAPFEFAWNTTIENNGERTLQVRAVDIAGRRAESAARVVRVSNASPSVRLLSPSAGEKVLMGGAYRLRWKAGAGNRPLSSFRVEAAADGKTFAAVPGCAALPASADVCIWNAPGPASKRAVVRVTAVDTAGATATSISAPFTLASGTPTLTVKAPNKAVTLGIGASHAFSWSTNMSDSELMVELSRDGGQSWEVVAPSVFQLVGDQRWIIAGPPTAAGLLRIRSPNTLVEDVSNARFSIAPVTLSVTAPNVKTSWRVGTQVAVKWASNLGSYDRLNVRLSLDGGSTYPVLLAGSVAGDAVAGVKIIVPAMITNTARVLVESLVNPAWRAESAVFRIAP